MAVSEKERKRKSSLSSSDIMDTNTSMISAIKSNSSILLTSVSYTIKSINHEIPIIATLILCFFLISF